MKTRLFTIFVLCALAFVIAGCSGPAPENKGTQAQSASEKQVCEKCGKPCAECKCTDCKCRQEVKPAAEEKPAENPAAEPKPAEAVIQAYPYDPTSKEVDDALKAMQLENTPTLGPVFKEWMLAAYQRDFNKAYSYISTASKAAMLQVAGARIFSDKATVTLWEKQLQDPNLGDDQRKVLQAEIAKIKEYIAGREACKGDGAKLYGYITDWVAKGNSHNPIHGYVYGPPLKFIKEVFKDNAGYILTSDPPGANKMYFVKEQDGWKYDMAGTVQIADENDPPQQQQQVVPMPQGPQG